VVPEAAPIIFSDPFAFLLACSLDRGTKAEVVWTIPYDLTQALGGLDLLDATTVLPWPQLAD